MKKIIYETDKQIISYYLNQVFLNTLSLVQELKQINLNALPSSNKFEMQLLSYKAYINNIISFLQEIQSKRD